MKRIALVLPGRGSYTEASLGSLPPGNARVQEAEAVRKEFELEPLLELDGAGKFSKTRHLRPANVSALIYVKSVLDADTAMAAGRAVVVTGNSMGWYTALAVAGSLSFADGFRLVQRMALLQEDGEPGGQIIYPLVDEDWRPVKERELAVEQALETAPAGEAFHSIHLGGYVVLAGSPGGLAHLTSQLPAVQQGRVGYPFRLALHGPYHTPLSATVAERSRRLLEPLTFRRPEVTLVDGFGRRHSPWSADVTELRDYTFGAQVTDPYDFTAAVRVALKEFAPDQLVLPGPGNSLGGVCGQVLVSLGWGGVHSKADFVGKQAGAHAPVWSMG